MDKKTQLRRLLWVIITLVVILIIGFFISTWFKFNGKPIEYNALIGSYYTDSVVFDIQSDTVVYYSEIGSCAYDIKSYSNNVLELSALSNEMTLTVLDVNTLYCVELKIYLQREKL